MLASGVDGQGSVIAGYREMEAIISYSKISNSALPAEIQGEDGTMTIDAINLPRKLTVRYRDGRVKEVDAPEQGLVMSYETRAFIAAIEEGAQESSDQYARQFTGRHERVGRSKKAARTCFPG